MQLAFTPAACFVSNATKLTAKLAAVLQDWLGVSWGVLTGLLVYFSSGLAEVRLPCEVDLEHMA